MLFPVMQEDVNLLEPRAVGANRRGQITEAQERWLKSMIGWGQTGSVLLIALFLIPFACIFPFQFLGQPDSLFYVTAIISGIIFISMLGLAAFPLWKIWDNSIKLRHDRENRAIRQGQGQLAFGKSGYVVQAAGRELAIPLTRNMGKLLPGATYRFYYLEETGFVLSAEELYLANATQTRSVLRDILASANNFSVEDLELNRNGDISQSQRMRALPRVIWGVMIGFFSFVLLLFTPGGVGMSNFSLDSIFRLVLAGVPLLFSGWLFFNALMDMFFSSLSNVEGLGQKEKRVSGGKGRSTRYYYVISGQSFQVSKKAYEALIDGQEYRLYYLPCTKKLVSIEPIDVNPDSAQYNFNA